MKCKQCGAELVEDASFCRCCGAKVDISDQMRACPACGYEAKPWEKFCQRCGTKLDSNDIFNDEESEIEENDQDSCSEKVGFWNKLDRAMQNEIIIGSFLLYLFALAYVAKNTFAIWITIIQFVMLTLLVFLRQKNSKINKPGVRPLIILMMVCFGFLYLLRFVAHSA